MPDENVTTLFDDDIEPYDPPEVNWSAKQIENWEQAGQPVYEKLQTECGRYWYRRTWRPKMRNKGMMKRDHVRFGTPEDYVQTMVEGNLEPMGSIHKEIMRTVTISKEKRELLDDAVEDITRAKLQRIEETDPGRARRILQGAQKVAELYGIDS